MSRRNQAERSGFGSWLGISLLALLVVTFYQFWINILYDIADFLNMNYEFFFIALFVFFVILYLISHKDDDYKKSL